MITACIITKNQQEKLEKCLAHLKSFELEIVVVDTGSNDDSRIVAKKYTDNVYEFPWVNDFAAAKNYAIGKASSNIVFVVDSDEYLDEFDAAGIERQISNNKYLVGRVKRTNFFEDGEEHEGVEWINRIFDKRYFHYVGKIHEQVERIDEEDYSTFRTAGHLLHDGYVLNDEERDKKTKRNIDLLKEELESLLSEYEGVDFLELPKKIQEKAAYYLYQLGKSYYMRREYKEAVEYFELGLSFDLNERQEYVIDMVETYGYAMINAGMPQRAILLESVYDQFSGRADFCYLMGLIYMNNERFDDAIAQFEKAATFNTASIKGVNSYAAYYNAGVICECLNRLEDAKRYYSLAGDYEKAVKRLQEI